MRQGRAFLSGVLVAAGILALPGSAHSHPHEGLPYPPGSVPWVGPYVAPPVPQKRWYGWQILTITTASTPTMTAGLGLGFALANGGETGGISPGYFAVGSLGAVGFVFGGPLVHFAHGHVRRGFLSMGMMLGAGAIGASAGWLSCGDCSGSRAFGSYGAAVFAGSSLAMLVANVVDISVLAYDDVPARAPRRGDRESFPTLFPLPYVDVAGDRTTVGLSGMF